MTANTFLQIFFLIFSFLIILRGLYIVLKGYKIFGKPPIHASSFILSKLCAIIIIIYPVLITLGLKNHTLINHHYFICAGIGLYLLGMTLFVLALYNLNPISLKIGLPTEKTMLQKNGLYRFSRNPIYLSMFITSLGSIIYSQNILVLSCLIISTYLHIKIIKREEHFLQDRFGTDWTEYRKKVRRFL